MENNTSSVGKKLYKGKVLMRMLIIIIVIAICFMLGLYGAAAIVFKNGNYSVMIEMDDDTSKLISLSETVDFVSPTVYLACPGVDSMTNISGNSLPMGLHELDGSNNGQNYIAYSFYLKNLSSESISLSQKMVVVSSLLNADEAIRIRVYKDGKYDTYAKVSADGVPEYGTTSFSGSTVFDISEDMASEQIIKYTIVIWLEGDDPECLDNIRGGAVRLSLNFTIDERRE